MKVFTPFRAVAFLALALLCPANEEGDLLVRKTDPKTPEEERAGFQLPEGFHVTLFAAEPEIHKPMNLGFDERGRLWVTSSGEYPFAAAKDRWSDPQGTRVKDSPDAVKILEDTDGDGRADKVTVFADGLNIPIGVVPWTRPGDKAGCIAWSIPNIWYFGDKDGDDAADSREILFGPLGYERDTHGMIASMRLGADGWVYATHGFSNVSVLQAKDGSRIEMTSGNVFRFRPDGSRVELWSSGQVNPFGMDWSRRGDLFTADCHSNPLTLVLRGACYPSFGRPHDGLGYAPVICEHSHGSTGLCGVVYIDGDVWGPEWNDRMLVGNCVTSRINQDRMEYQGSSPRAVEVPDFLTSTDPWFRPVDLRMGPDNALYVADFYNRIIGHYEVPLTHPGRDRSRGRIWKITRAGASKTPRPRPEPAPRSVADLRSADPFTRRAAAAWLAERPDREAIEPLFEALAEVDAEDPQLTHQLRIALREHLQLPDAYERVAKHADAAEGISLAVKTGESAAFLLSRSTWKQSPEIWAQMIRHGDAETVEGALKAAREFVGGENGAAQAGWVETAHGALLERGGVLPPALLEWAAEVATRLLEEGTGQEWVEERTADSESPWGLERRTLDDGRGVLTLSSLASGVGGNEAERRTGRLLSHPFVAPARLSVWICGHDNPPGEEPAGANYVALVRVADQQELRRVFVPRNDTAIRTDWDLSELAGERVRLEVVDANSRDLYAWVGLAAVEPEVVAPGAFLGADLRGEKLKKLAVLLGGAAPVDLRDRLTPFLPPAVAAPVVVDEKARAERAKAIEALAAGFASETRNADSGRNVFQAHCAICHQIRGEGGITGPQLDGIGTRGSARILEDVLDPGRNVDAHFRVRVFHLRDGTSQTGFVRAEVGEAYALLTAAGEDVRIAKADVERDEELAFSLMPDHFLNVLTRQQILDLTEWLLSQ